MNKPRVLVVYYSQTGQLRQILDSIISGTSDQLDISIASIEPVSEWRFPWNSSSFFDAMPESVAGLPAPVHRLPEDVRAQKYDLVILGWQPWFLHPSQPITAFLQSEDAQLLKDTPVVTVAGCRNMWLNAGELLKARLQMLGARHVGNIVLVDPNSNLISLITIIRWLFSGEKQAGRWLPEAGVPAWRAAQAARFGGALVHAAQSARDSTGSTTHADVSDLQARLMTLGAISLNPALVLLERQAVSKFRFWANHIREKGGPGSADRRHRVAAFKWTLFAGVTLLSPLSGCLAAVRKRLTRRQLRNDVAYFSGVGLESGRI